LFIYQVVTIVCDPMICVCWTVSRVPCVCEQSIIRYAEWSNTGLTGMLSQCPGKGVANIPWYECQTSRGNSSFYNAQCLVHRTSTPVVGTSVVYLAGLL